MTCLLPIPGQDGSRVALWPGAAVPCPAHIVIVSSYLLASMAIHVPVLSRQGTIPHFRVRVRPSFRVRVRVRVKVRVRVRVRVRIRVRVRVREPGYCKPAILKQYTSFTEAAMTANGRDVAIQPYATLLKSYRKFYGRVLFTVTEFTVRCRKIYSK